MEGITYSEQIEDLIEGLKELRSTADPEIARELAIAITNLEDARMRVNRAGAWIHHGHVTSSNLL